LNWYQGEATVSSQLHLEESWAYRARSEDPLVEVKIVRIGTKRPARVFIKFVAMEFEGREEWVPPARLKVRWADVGAFEARERRWQAVFDVTDPDEHEESAASVVFDLLIDPTLAELGYNYTEGVLSINDAAGLSDFLGVDPAAFVAPPAFEDAGRLIAPWSVAHDVAHDAAARMPDPILRYVDQQEQESRREAVFGRSYPRRGTKSWDVPPEICLESDAEHGRPVRDLLRAWSGQQAVDEHDLVLDLRAEVQRLTALTVGAIETLARIGAVREARKLERELQSPRTTDRRRPSGRSTDE
jgi:hypothetical protein